MARRPWLERVAEALKRRGLPAPARERLLSELRDHLEDLTEQGCDMDVASQVEDRMGRPDEVAAAAVREHRRAGWAGRHPLLVFGLAPLPAAVLAIVGCVVAIGLSLAALGDEVPRPAAVGALVGCSYALRFVPFVLAAVWLGRLAARQRVGRGWLAVAVGQVALFGGSFVSRVVVTHDAPGGASWVMGFSWPLEEGTLMVLGHPASWWQLPQLLAPLAAAWAVLARCRRAAA